MVRYSKCSGINSLKLQLNSLSDILFKWIFFWPTMRWNVVCATKGFECWVGLHLALSPSAIQSIVADLEQFTSKRVGDRGCFALPTISFLELAWSMISPLSLPTCSVSRFGESDFLSVKLISATFGPWLMPSRTSVLASRARLPAIFCCCFCFLHFLFCFHFSLGVFFHDFTSRLFFKVRHFTNAFPSKRSKIVEHVLLHPISQFTKTSLFSWKMRATLLKLDDKYKLAKKTMQKQLSVTSMPAATGLWRLTGQLPGTLKKSHTFL